MGRYLPGVDGLRAVAVLAVVAYHAGLPIPAGFVGVDVFFVISGYLITRLLHDEVLATGRIDFMAFYARRARRILPALVVVVVATLGASALMLSPQEWEQASRSAAAAFLFAANLFFNAAPSGYFDPAPDAAPLLHLWSLGVEEQFYIVWPVVLLLTRKNPVRALSVLAVASFIAAEWLLSNGHGQAAFYQMPARAWELALGGLVALRPVTMPKGSAWVALLVTLAACMVPLGRFPGVGALPAVLGAAALIAAIQSGDRCGLLEYKPIVGVGLISYSLYLWHWPVLLFGRMWLVHDLALVALAFVLAIASYFWIETPARRQVLRPRADVLAAVIVPMMGLAGVLMLPTSKQDASGPTIYSMGCDDWYSSARVKPCVFGPYNAPKTAVVIGDSIGMQWFPALIQVFKAPEWRVIALTKSACPMVDEPLFYKLIGREYTECAQWRKAALEKVASLNADVVILGSTDTYAFTPEQWTQGTRHVLQIVSPAAGQVRIIRATPQRSGETNPLAYQRQASVASEFRNASMVDMNDLICAERCMPIPRGPVMFRDAQHLDASFVRTLSASLEARLGLHAK